MEQEGCRIRLATENGRTRDLNIRNVRDSELPGRFVKCNRGEAVLHDESSICWRLTGQSEREENLASEQSAIAMQMSVFLRRVAGGLIPTADLRDLHRAYVAAQTIANARF